MNEPETTPRLSRLTPEQEWDAHEAAFAERVEALALLELCKQVTEHRRAEMDKAERALIRARNAAERSLKRLNEAIELLEMSCRVASVRGGS